MSKILLVSEKISDQIAFISFIKKITNKPLSEIRECLIQKKPIYEGSAIENEKIILDILNFAKNKGDKIKIFQDSYEITEETFHNSIKMGGETRRRFGEDDEIQFLLEASSGSNQEICKALASMASYDDHWKGAQDQCLHFLDHPDPNVRGMSVVCLGRIARIHQTLDREIVETALSKYLQDEEISANVEAALDTIRKSIE